MHFYKSRSLSGKIMAFVTSLHHENDATSGEFMNKLSSKFYSKVFFPRQPESQAIRRQFSQVVTIALFSLAGALSWPVAAQPVDQLLTADTNLTIFANALEKSGLLQTLNDSGSYTVFAPTDTAMKNEGSAFLLETVLLAKSNHALLLDQLSYHIVDKPHPPFNELADPLELTTLAGTCLIVYPVGSALKIGPESVVTGSIRGDNGIIYLVDRLLWQSYEHKGSSCSSKLISGIE